MSTTRVEYERGFYITGGTLGRDASCYVSRQADAELYDNLTRGKFCYVLTARQMGKSSLMIRTAARLSEEGTAVAVLDLTAIGQNLSAEQWYYGLLGQVGQQLDLEDEFREFWLGHTLLGPLQRWMRALREVMLPRHTNRVVIFIDEIDAVRSLPFSTDEFFAGLRELYNNRTADAELERLTFCLLGVASPSDLILDTRTTPFNIGRRIELHDFTDGEATLLERGMERDEETSAALLKRILYWTGGHPYLTQRLCQVVTEDVSARDAFAVDQLCEELFLSRRARELDDNLLFVRERMLRSEADLTSLLTLYAQIHAGRQSVYDDEANPLVQILRLSGITRVCNDRLRTRNRIYERAFDEEWVRENLPEAEMRRQHAAYRRGLIRALTIAGVILTVICGLAVVAVKQRNRAEEEAYRNRRLLYTAQMNLAHQAWGEASAYRPPELLNALFPKPGGGGTGRLAMAGQTWGEAGIDRTHELLNAHLPKPGEEDLRGFEWYYLWQLSHAELLTLHHGSPVTFIALSPDGTKLAAQSSFGDVTLWDVVTGRQLFAIENKRGSGIAFSPDGKLLAFGNDHNDKGVVKLWDVAAKREADTLRGHAQHLDVVVFSPDGQKMATARRDKNTVKIWEVATGKELATCEGHKSYYVALISFSQDGKMLATWSYDQPVMLWEVSTGRVLKIFQDQPERVRSVAFSPDGYRIAAGYNSAIARIWNIDTGVVESTMTGHSASITSIAYSPDGKTLATGSHDGTIKIWDRSGQELATFKGHEGGINTVVFTSDGKKIASGSRDGTIKLWQVRTSARQDTLGEHAGNILSITFSPDGRRMATAVSDQSFKLWDVITGDEVTSLDGHVRSELDGNIPRRRHLAVAFSPDGRKVVTGSSDRTIKIWDGATGRELKTLTGHGGLVCSVAFSPDGKTIASGSEDTTVRLWDADTGRVLSIFELGALAVPDVAFSPNGKTLATGRGYGDDFTVKLWDVARGREVRTLNGHTSFVTSLAYSPDGKVLATASYDKTIRFWDALTGKELSTLKGHTSEVMALAFSPDGRRLATGGADRTVKLWDLSTGQEVITLKGHRAQVKSVAFSPDGKTLASGSLDGDLKLWRAATDEEVQARSR